MVKISSSERLAGAKASYGVFGERYVAASALIFRDFLFATVGTRDPFYGFPQMYCSRCHPRLTPGAFFRYFGGIQSTVAQSDKMSAPDIDFVFG